MSVKIIKYIVLEFIYKVTQNILESIILIVS